MLTLGERLKYLRKKTKLTQQEVANNLLIHRDTYNKYENNKRLPDIETLKKICLFFDVSADFLIGLTSNVKPYDNTEDLYAIINSSKNLNFDNMEISEEDKNIIISTIKHALDIVNKINKKKE